MAPSEESTLVSTLDAPAKTTGGDLVAVDGKALWSDKRGNCALCHGADGKGQTPVGKKMYAPDMTSAAWQTAVTDARILEVVLKGYEKDVGGKKFQHRPLKDATQEEADALRVHIRSFAPAK